MGKNREIGQLHNRFRNTPPKFRRRKKRTHETRRRCIATEIKKDPGDLRCAAHRYENTQAYKYLAPLSLYHPMAALRHDKLVALPSLSCALSSLPQATSLDSVSLHPSMYAQHAADSEAKARRSPLVLCVSHLSLAQKSLVQDRVDAPQRSAPTSLYAVGTYSHPPPRPCLTPSQPSHADSPNSSPPLMMRKSVRLPSPSPPLATHHPVAKAKIPSLDGAQTISTPRVPLFRLHPVAGSDDCRPSIAQNTRGTPPTRCISFSFSSRIPHQRIASHRYTCIPSYIHTMASLPIFFFPLVLYLALHLARSLSCSLGPSDA